MQKRFLLFIIPLFCFSNSVFNQELEVTKYFEWYKKCYEINDVEFSHTGDKIAFSLKFTVPDGGNAIGREKYIDSLFKVISKNPRFADPNIGYLDIKTREFLRFDYGWAPSFSRTDNYITYIAQKVPISGKRNLAESFKGNSLNIYCTETNSIKVLIKNPNQLLFNPSFLNDSTIIYEIGDAVNGAFAGSIGIKTISTNGRNDLTIYKPQKNFGYYNIIGKVFTNPDPVSFLIYQPNDKGIMYMAREYKKLIANQNRIILDLGIKRLKNISDQISLKSDGTVVLIDNSSDSSLDTVWITTFYNGLVPLKEPLFNHFYRGYLSPNAQYLVYETYSHELILNDLTNHYEVNLKLPFHELFGIYWAPTSREFAVVTLHEEYIDTDNLSIFKIK